MVPLRPRHPTAVLIAVFLWLGSTFLLPAQKTLPAGPGADLAYAKCQPCHSMGVVIQSSGISRVMWLGVMEEMKEFGMKVTPAEHEALIEYLATYLGPNPPPAPEHKPAAPAAATLDGANLFDRHCSACHGKDGTGASEQMPPLAGNPYLSKDSRYTIAVLLYGLQGPITIKGRTYDGVMPGFGHLDDGAITAIANYTLTAWGVRALPSSDSQPPTVENVKSIRTEGLNPVQVARRRQQLR